MRRLALLAILLGASCANDDTTTPITPDAGFGGDAQLQVGTGDFAFVPVAEGDPVAIVLGPQGGYHIFISLRARGINNSGLRMEVGVLDAETRTSLSAETSIRGRMSPAEDDWVFRPALLGILDVPPQQIHGTDVILWGRVRDANGTVIENEVRARAILGGVTPDAGFDDAGVSVDTGPPIVRRNEACTANATGEDGWTLLCDDSVGHFLSVWGSGPNDVYVVGGVPAAGGFAGETGVFHFDGTSLQRVPMATTERAWWVFGYGPDEVYIGGENGMLLRGRNRAFERIDTGTTQTIFGMWGPHKDRLYFVSGDFTDPDARGELRVLTSTVVSKVSAPALDAYDGQALFKVWGSADNDVFLVGEKGAVFHFDGNAWSRMTTPANDLPILTVSGRGPNDVYAVGGRTEGAVWRYDGSDWSDATPGASIPILMGVHTSTMAGVLISGDSGFAGTVAEASVIAAPTMTTRPLHAVWHDGAGGLWAVGGNFQSQTGEAIGVVVRKSAPVCPPGGLSGEGFHHLDLQGRNAAPMADGTYEMFDVARGDIHPRLVHGEHYLLGAASRVEFSVPLCADITDEVAIRIPNNDEPGADVLHELLIVKPDGREILVASAIDAEAGSSGYLPFDRSNLPAAEVADIAATNTSVRGTELGWHDFADAPPFPEAPRDIYARVGDTLLFRTTNISNKMYGLMIWFPQNGLEYQAFLEVRVPASPGGESGIPRPPPPELGPCEPPSPNGFIELGRGTMTFQPFPPNQAVLETGPQGSLMFRVAVRGRGFNGGNVTDPLDPMNPLLHIDLALDAMPSAGGRIVADGRWQRGFTTVGDDLVLVPIRPTVPVGAANRSQLMNAEIYAEVRIVDATTGTTYCQDLTFTAVMQ